MKNHRVLFLCQLIRKGLQYRLHLLFGSHRINKFDNGFLVIVAKAFHRPEAFKLSVIGQWVIFPRVAC